MIVLKNIEMTLDDTSIDRAIRELEFFTQKLKPAMTHLIETLIERGVEIARAELIIFPKPAFDTGALSESIGCGMLNPETGVVTTGVTYAVYVEYGTGEYAANGDGRQGGWTYYDTLRGQFRFTMGMAPRPFMYRTLRDLEDEAKAIGGKVIAEYIA